MLCRLQTCHSLASKILWLPPTPTYQVKAFKTWEEFSLFHIILFFCSLHKVIRVQKKWNKHRKSIMTWSDHSSYICKIFFNLEFPAKLNRTKGRKGGGTSKKCGTQVHPMGCLLPYADSNTDVNHFKTSIYPSFSLKALAAPIDS